MLIDTHCHLDWDSFQSYQGELDEVLQRSRSAGVEAFVTIGTDVGRNRKAKEIAQQHADVYQCMGYHPDVVTQEGFDEVMMNEWLKELELGLGGNKIVGVGEIGLDYLAMKRNNQEQDASQGGSASIKMQELQKELFERQILIAVREGLPVSLHVRDECEQAYWDALELLTEYYDVQAGEREYLFSLPALQASYEMELPSGTKAVNVAEKKIHGVLHCFSGPKDYVLRAVDLGFMIGVCGNVTFKNAQPLRDILKEVPLEMVVLETDAPFLAPVPYRGKTNEPAWMVETAKCVAEVKGVSFEEVCRVTTENAKRLFKI